MNKKKLKNTLKKHEEWLSTKGKSGEKADLNGENLDLVNLEKCDLSYANIENAEINRASLSFAKLIGANLKNANLNNSILSEANFSGAILIGAQLNGANMPGSILKKAKCYNASFIGASLGKADFTDANLMKTNFRSAYLRKTILRNTNLRKSELFVANLAEADLTGANITGANIWGISYVGWKIKGIKADYVYNYYNLLDGKVDKKEKNNTRRDFKNKAFEEIFESLPTIDLLISGGLSPRDYLNLVGLCQLIQEKKPNYDFKIKSMKNIGIDTVMRFTIKKDSDLEEATKMIAKISLEKRLEHRLISILEDEGVSITRSIKIENISRISLTASKSNGEHFIIGDIISISKDPKKFILGTKLLEEGTIISADSGEKQLDKNSRDPRKGYEGKVIDVDDTHFTRDYKIEVTSGAISGGFLIINNKTLKISSKEFQMCILIANKIRTTWYRVESKYTDAGWVSYEDFLGGVHKWRIEREQPEGVSPETINKAFYHLNKKIRVALGFKNKEEYLIENGKSFGCPGCYRLKVHPDYIVIGD